MKGQRNRGISLNAVSPASPKIYNAFPFTQNQNIDTFNRGHSRSSLSATHASEADDSIRDIPLPDLDKLMAMEIDEQLRLLALKEMVTVEIKDQINNLQRKLKKEEEELHRLREVIQRTLYKEMGGTTSITSTHAFSSSSGNTSEPRDAAVRSTRSRRRTLSIGGTTTLTIEEEEGEGEGEVGEIGDGIKRNSSIRTPSKQNSKPNLPSKKERPQSSLWSNLSKPLDLIQQFDTMLQNEFEKSLIPQQYHPEREKDSIQDSNRKPRTSEDSTSSGITTASSPLTGKYTGGEGILYEEKIQTVSLSLWSFVSEVKTNVLSSLADDDKSDGMMYNLDTGSTVSLDNYEHVPQGHKPVEDVTGTADTTL